MPRPGEKHEASQKRAKTGLYSATRRLWTTCVKFGSVIYVREPQPGQGEPGPQVMLSLTSPMGKGFAIDLTSLTTEQLTAFRYVVDTALATALPIVLERDNAAEHSFEEGDESSARLYAAPCPVWKRPARAEYDVKLDPTWKGDSGMELIQTPRTGTSQEGTGGYV